MHRFDTVTLLVTHYNRSQSLERLLQSFEARNISFADIVISDDGSKPEQIDYINSLAAKYKFRLITTPKNKGLGNNINKGQDAVETELTLYVQEDFEPSLDYGTHLANAVSIMTERPETDIVRFYAYFKYPYLKPYKYGYAEMLFKIWYPGSRKFHMYSDHPHLRRKNFLQRFGRYAEGIKGDRTEFLMALSFLKNNGKAMFYEKYRELFEQINTADEPSTMTRGNLRQTENVLISVIRSFYRNVKHTAEYLTMKRVS